MTAVRAIKHESLRRLAVAVVVVIATLVAFAGSAHAADKVWCKPTDAVWTLLMIMEHYQTMYEQIPRQIAEAARNATETIRVTAEAQAKAARDETRKGLMKAVTEAVRATAKQLARAEHLKWVSVAVSIVSITVSQPSRSVISVGSGFHSVWS